MLAFRVYLCFLNGTLESVKSRVAAPFWVRCAAGAVQLLLSPQCRLIPREGSRIVADTIPSVFRHSQLGGVGAARGSLERLRERGIRLSERVRLGVTCTARRIFNAYV